MTHRTSRSSEPRGSPQLAGWSRSRAVADLCVSPSNHAVSTRATSIFAGVLALVVGALVGATRWANGKAESVQCGNYMASIGYAARLWASEHDDHLPSDLLSMSNEVTVPKILVCPGDHLRKPAPSWIEFAPEYSSYEIVTPSLKEGDRNGVFLRCKIHGHLGYADATVYDGVRRRTKIP